MNGGIDLEVRKIKESYAGRPSTDGAGVKLNRIFGYHETPAFDPFLLLDFFDSRDPAEYEKGFPWHPHRGIETVTYVISGRVAHGDSLGNEGVIRDGECQWMTAGSGIVHQEMPQESPHLFGVQLWVNLPADRKMDPPAYRDMKASDMPEVVENHGTVKVIAGTYKSVQGPVSGMPADPTLMDVAVRPYGEFRMEMDPDLNVSVFILQGKGFFDEAKEDLHKKGVALSYGPGNGVSVKAGCDGVRFLYFSGRPIGEPIAWRGPIVMNTKEELDQAFSELDRGVFVKDRSRID